MQPLKLQRRTMIDLTVPENHVIATFEAAQVPIFYFHVMDD